MQDTMLYIKHNIHLYFLVLKYGSNWTQTQPIINETYKWVKNGFLIQIFQVVSFGTYQGIGSLTEDLGLLFKVLRSIPPLLFYLGHMCVEHTCPKD